MDWEGFLCDDGIERPLDMERELECDLVWEFLNFTPIPRRRGGGIRIWSLVHSRGEGW